jgi:hypothetical protein
MEDDTLYKEDLPFFFCERQEDDKTDKRYSLLPPPSHRAAVSMADSEGVGEKTTDREGEVVREWVGRRQSLAANTHTCIHWCEGVGGEMKPTHTHVQIREGVGGEMTDSEGVGGEMTLVANTHTCTLVANTHTCTLVANTHMYM